MAGWGLFAPPTCTAAQIHDDLSLGQVGQLHGVAAPETEVGARGRAKRAVGCAVAHRVALLYAHAARLLAFGRRGVGVSHHPALGLLGVRGSARKGAAAQPHQARCGHAGHADHHEAAPHRRLRGRLVTWVPRPPTEFR